MKNKGSPEGFYKLLSSALVIPDGPLSFFTHLCDSCFKDLEEVGVGGRKRSGEREWMETEKRRDCGLFSSKDQPFKSPE